MKEKDIIYYDTVVTDIVTTKYGKMVILETGDLSYMAISCLNYDKLYNFLSKEIGSGEHIIGASVALICDDERILAISKYNDILFLSDIVNPFDGSVLRDENIRYIEEVYGINKKEFMRLVKEDKNSLKLK